MNTRRSYLFVPSLKQSMMVKAMKTDADSVIFDLEDAVAVSEKDKARANVAEVLATLAEKKNVYVRINDVSTPHWEEDVAVSIKHGANGIVVPKTESTKDIQRVCEKVRDAGREADFKVIPLLETAKGIEFAFEIASADNLISHLAFGSIDFSLDVGCELTESASELLYARSRMVVASRAAGIGRPVDSAFPDLKNEDGLRNETLKAKQLGFGGKLLIHPKQIDIVHAAFTGDANELAEARLIVEKFEEAEREGAASISVNDKLVDYPVYKKAKERLEAGHGNENTR